MKYISILLLLTLVLAACATSIPTEGDASKALTTKTRPAKTAPVETVPGVISAEVPLGEGAGAYLGRDGMLNGKSLGFLGAGFYELNGVRSRFEERIILIEEPGLGVHSALTWAFYDYWGITTMDSEAIGQTHFLPAAMHSMKYQVVLSEPAILDQVSSDTPLNIMFLGKNLKIVDKDPDSLILEMGERFDIGAGESVVVNGKTVTLLRTTSISAIVDVDGVTVAIDENEEYNFGGLSVQTISVDNHDGVELDRAVLLIGNPTEANYDHNDEFIGEDLDDPAWVWDLRELPNGVIGIQWALDIDRFDEDDNPDYTMPAKAGDSYYFPNNFAQVQYDGLVNPNYETFEFSIKTEDLLSSNGSEVLHSDASVIELVSRSYNDRGIIFSSGMETDYVYLYDEGETLGVYAKLPGSSDKVKVFETNNDGTLFQITGSTSVADENLIDVGLLNWSGNSGVLTLSNAANDEVLHLVIQSEFNQFLYLGDGMDDINLIYDLYWTGHDMSIDLSFRESGLLLESGIVMPFNITSDLSQDQLVFNVPATVPAKGIVRVQQRTYTPPPVEEPGDKYVPTIG